MRSVKEIECGWVERDVLQHLVLPSSVGCGVDAPCRLALLPFPQGEHAESWALVLDFLLCCVVWRDLSKVGSSRLCSLFHGEQDRGSVCYHCECYKYKHQTKSNLNRNKWHTSAWGLNRKQSKLRSETPVLILPFYVLILITQFSCHKM